MNRGIYVAKDCLFLKENKCSVLNCVCVPDCNFFKKNTYKNRKKLEDAEKLIKRYAEAMKGKGVF